MKTLKAKTLLITGASRGIGREIALRAARDGANVVVAAKTADPHPKLAGTIHSVAAEIEAAGGKALPIQLDVRDDAAIAHAFALTAKTFGGLDILVNNASAISLTPTLATPAKRFDLMLGVNARATFLCSQAAIGLLKKSSNPHILTLSPPLNMDAKSVNSLWPRTTIATAAVEVHFPDAILKASRHAAIMADAAHVILTSEARSNTGNFYIDEEVLKHAGEKDFSRYAVTPGVPLFQDLFVE
ncbi:MAG: SDR family NAD(P)-dependent oxidoreductase [Betaproteobacteria bacterium]|nr:MAG: SDR family NAD(P)-dependent oxidoreductase [Betaproteobacteria bacterium]